MMWKELDRLEWGFELLGREVGRWRDVERVKVDRGRVKVDLGFEFEEAGAGFDRVEIRLNREP